MYCYVLFLHCFCILFVSPAEVSPKNKMSLAPSNSSSSRRCSGRNLGVHELSLCEQLTVDIVRHEDSWPFMKLVSRTQVNYVNNFFFFICGLSSKSVIIHGK